MLIKSTVCKVLDFNEIPMVDASPLRFRVEIIKLYESDSYDALFYRRETFRVTPSFDRDEAGREIIADHEFFVADDVWSQFSFVSSTEEETIRLVQARMLEIFTPVSEREPDSE